ncbi:MAG: HAD family hydrolase [Oscillospiraceae bacterium]|nr:HAD family hydrolase [Oscillospiraceae bacterium]
MFDGILFDLDGTLWDACPQLTVSWNQALELHHVPREPLAVQEVRDCMGLLLHDIAEKLLPMLPRKEQDAVIHDCVRLELDYLAKHGGSLFPREVETLTALAAQCPLFVVSNCEDGYIEAFYQGTGLGQYFTDYESAGRTGLPKSENIKLVAERNGLRNPVYVGDTALDCSSAREAGVPFLHAAYGFGKVPGVPAARSFEELPTALARLTQ